MTIAVLSPIGDRVAVLPEKMTETTTDSGIIVPEVAQPKPVRGVVKAIGPGNLDDDGNYIPMFLNVGDVVVFPKYSGHPMDWEGEEVVIMHESEVLALIEFIDTDE